jgi:hypothetical protein
MSKAYNFMLQRGFIEDFMAQDQNVVVVSVPTQFDNRVSDWQPPIDNAQHHLGICTARLLDRLD